MLCLALSTLSAHAPPTYLPVPPLRVQGNSLVDATGTPFVLRGVELPGLETATPPPAATTPFTDTPALIFSLHTQPSTRNIPGAVAGTHRAADWSVWQQGGALTGGRTAIGMQALVDAIRMAGAPQVIAAPAFHDSLGFQ